MYFPQMHRHYYRRLLFALFSDAPFIALKPKGKAGAANISHHDASCRRSPWLFFVAFMS